MPLWSRGLGLSLVALVSVPFANADRVTNTNEQGKTARQVIVASETAMKDVKSFHVVGMVGGKATASSFSLSLSATGGGGEVSVPGATLKLVVAAGTRVHQGQRSELAEIDREQVNGAVGGQPLDKSTCKQH